MNTKRILILILIFHVLIYLIILSISALAQDGTWVEKADMPTSRTWFATSVVNGVIYVIGGGPESQVVEAYDPGTNTWTKKTNMPTGREGPSASVVNGVIYTIGGGYIVRAIFLFLQLRLMIREQIHGQKKPICQLQDMGCQHVR